jgi:hypothetical protein
MLASEVDAFGRVRISPEEQHGRRLARARHGQGDGRRQAAGVEEEEKFTQQTAVRDDNRGRAGCTCLTGLTGLHGFTNCCTGLHGKKIRDDLTDSRGERCHRLLQRLRRALGNGAQLLTIGEPTAVVVRRVLTQAQPAVLRTKIVDLRRACSFAQGR